MSPIAERLRNLPDFDPPEDGWLRLQRRLPSPRRRARRLAGGLALAASLLVAVGALFAPQTGRIAGSGGDLELEHLMRRSQALEQDLARLRPQVAVWDERHAAAAQSIENRLAVVDLQLNYAEPASARRLWRDRIALMSTLVQTHQGARQLALPDSRLSDRPEWSL